MSVITPLQARIADLGKLMQIAYVVDDLDDATRYWVDVMGVGPFFQLEAGSEGADLFEYRGTPCQANYSVRIGYWGEVQVELIRQNNDAPSIYSKWRNGECLHHTCIMVDDMAKALKVCAANGAALLQEGKYGDAHFAYVDTGRGPGSILELFMAPGDIRERYARFREAARNWTGERPVRGWDEL